MDVTHALVGEHGVFHLLVEQLDDATGRCGTVGELRAASEPLAVSLLGHARIEEETIFLPIEQRLGKEGPTKCLRHEHLQMDQRLRGLFRYDDLDAMRAEIRSLLDLVRRHLQREEQVLVVSAVQQVPAEERENLGAHWIERRGIVVGGPVQVERT